MRKALFTVLATIGVAILLPATVFATQANSDVTGVVSDAGKSVIGAKITAECNGFQGTDKTDSTGSYLVKFLAKKCPAGSPVSVTATTKAGLVGTASGTVNPDGSTKLNVAIVNVTIGLPEMGVLTGSVAALTAGGTFLMVRRRSLAKG